jgi:ankyrin repeat protein
MVKLLVSSGANVNLKNSKGWTAMDIATQYKKNDVVQYLALQPSR